MAKAKRAKKKKPIHERWFGFSRRNLILSETILGIGLLQEILESVVLSQDQIPPMLRVLAAVGVVVGSLGGLLVIMRKSLQKSLSKTHGLMKKLPIPMPQLVGHSLIHFGLFAGYAWLWDEDTGALNALWEFLGM